MADIAELQVFYIFTCSAELKGICMCLASYSGIHIEPIGLDYSTRALGLNELNPTCLEINLFQHLLL